MYYIELRHILHLITKHIYICCFGIIASCTPPFKSLSLCNMGFSKSKIQLFKF